MLTVRRPARTWRRAGRASSPSSRTRASRSAVTSGPSGIPTRRPDRPTADHPGWRMSQSPEPDPVDPPAPPESPPAAAPSEPVEPSAEEPPDRDYEKSLLAGQDLKQQNSETHQARDELADTQVVRDIYAGNTNINNYVLLAEGGDLRGYQVPPEELDEPYIDAPGLTDIRRVLTDSPLVVVTGPAGYGKAATLLRALTRDLDGGPIVCLDPAT